MNYILSLLMVLFTSAAFSQTVLPGTRIASATFTKGTAAPTAYEQFVITAQADVGGSLSAKYFTFCLPNAGTCYAPWYDVDNTSTAPTVSGHTLVEIDIATGDTAATVGDNTQVAVTAVTGVTCTDNNAGVVTCVMDAKGPSTDATAGDTGWTISITQGLLATSAIASASVVTNLLGYQICNASANSSTWLAIGKTTDPETDGVRIAPGGCISCPSCTGQTLKDTKVSSQAASNDYTVVQFKE